MAFPPSFLLVTEDGIRGRWSRSGGGCIRRRPMLLTLSVCQEQEEEQSLNLAGLEAALERRDHPGLKPTQADGAGQVGLVRGSQERPGPIWQAAAAAALMSSLQPVLLCSQRR